jgi:hypothetical protein
LISEFADSNTSIYYTNIKNFIINNLDAVTDAINELGWDGCGGDLYKAGQMAEYLTIERALYNEVTDIVKHLAIEYITNVYSGLEVAENEELTDLLKEFNNNFNLIDCNDYIDIIADYCNEFVEKVKEL